MRNLRRNTRRGYRGGLENVCAEPTTLEGKWEETEELEDGEKYNTGEGMLERKEMEKHGGGRRNMFATLSL